MAALSGFEPGRDISLELGQSLLPGVHHVAGGVVMVLDAGQDAGRRVELRHGPVARAVWRSEVVTAAADEDLEVWIATQRARQIGARRGVTVALVFAAVP